MKSFLKKLKEELTIPKIVANVVIVILTLAVITPFYEHFTATYDADILIPTQLENNILKIKIENTGDKKIINGKLKIASCYMDKTLESSEIYNLPSLPPEKTHTLQFKNEITLREMARLDCSYTSKKNFLQGGGLGISFYRNKTDGNTLVFPVESGLYKCGICFWDIELIAEGFNMSFRKEVKSPIHLTISARNNGKIEVLNSSDTEFLGNATITPINIDEVSFLG